MGAVKMARFKKFEINTDGEFNLCQYQKWIKWLKRTRNKIFSGLIIDNEGIIKFAVEMHNIPGALKDTKR